MSDIDPAITAGLKILEEKAAFYRMAHGILTGKFDQKFTDWKNAERSKITAETPAELPDVEPILEWVYTKATTAELFLMQDKLNGLMAKVLAEIFGRYCEKDVRGSLPEGFDLVALGELRKDLVNTLNGTLQMGKSGMLPAVFADPATLEALESVGKRRKFGDSWQWDLPDAPSPEKSANGPVLVTGTNNFRAHNTTVKFVIDGQIPSDHPGKLGEAVDKYFPGMTTQDVGRLFEGWHSDWCGEGANKPIKALRRDNREIYFTIVG